MSGWIEREREKERAKERSGTTRCKQSRVSTHSVDFFVKTHGKELLSTESACPVYDEWELSGVHTPGDPRLTGVLTANRSFWTST